MYLFLYMWVGEGVAQIILLGTSGVDRWMGRSEKAECGPNVTGLAWIVATTAEFVGWCLMGRKEAQPKKRVLS